MATKNTPEQDSFPGFTPLPGACYCKKASYTLRAPPIFVNCCHCHNCQTLTGSAFAINIMVETEHLHISPPTSPSDLIVQDNYDEEGTFSGNATRCAHCHTLLYATAPFSGPHISYLRAGTLDDAGKHVVPDAHFFLRSKHPWVTLPAGAKGWDALPSQGEEMFKDEASEKRLRKATARSHQDDQAGR